MATTSSSNFTSLYGANASPIVPINPYGNADVVALLAASTDGANTIGNISATGNITGVYFFGNGSQLTGLGATYSNATVSSYLASGLNTANIITTANITGGNLTTTGVGGNIAGANVITATTVSVTGNITGGNLFGNGAGITGISVGAGTQIINGTSNVSVALNGNTTIGVASVTQAQISSQGISAVGNITGSYFLGNGSQLTGISAATAANSAVYLRDASNAAAYVNVDNSLKSVLLPGGGFISYSGDNVDPNTFGSIDVANPQTNLANAYSALTFINAANFFANPASTVNVNNNGIFVGYDFLNTNQTLNVGSAGVVTNTTFSAAGNITAPYFLGNGFALSSINGANVTGTVATATTAGTVTTAAQGNITSLGTLTSLSVTGNVVGGNITTGGVITATGNITGGNLQAQSLTGTTVSVSSTVIGGNLQTAGFASAVGNITGGNILTGGLITATASIAAGTTISAGGNITGANITGVSGSVATGIVNYKDFVNTITYAATITPNIALGSIQQVTLTGNVTMNAFGGTPQAGQSLVIKFIQDATGGRTLTSTMKWAGGNKTLSTAANAVDIASVFYDGTTYWASLTLAYA